MILDTLKIILMKEDELIPIDDINDEYDDYIKEIDIRNKRLKIPTKIKNEEEIESLLALIGSPDSINLITDIDKNYYGN